MDGIALRVIARTPRGMIPKAIELRFYACQQSHIIYEFVARIDMVQMSLSKPGARCIERLSLLMLMLSACSPV